MHKLVWPIPPEEGLWACVQCEMQFERDVSAPVLFVEGEPGQRGVVKTGLCATHAECLDLEGIKDAQEKYKKLLAE